MNLDLETLVCAFRGHVTPAATIAVVDPEDHRFGIDVHPSWRISRCLRCDAWIGAPPPATPERDPMAPLEQLHPPRRDKALRQAVILRLIAIERAIHSFIFTVIAVLGVVLLTHLASAKGAVQRYLQSLARSQAQSGRPNNNSIVVREGAKFLHLRTGTLDVLIVTAAIYAVVEGIEAVGLWREKRWAEYLTALATAGFLPFELYELAQKVTVLRVGALVINGAVLVYLVFAKHLFGIGAHKARLAEEESSRAGRVFSPPF